MEFLRILTRFSIMEDFQTLRLIGTQIVTMNKQTMKIVLSLYKPHPDKTNKMTFVPSEDSDQPGPAGLDIRPV